MSLGGHGVAPIVTLCGSMRFFRQMLAVAADLTARGHVVLAPFPIDESTAAERVSELAALHRRKIDMADLVLVVTDESGHIGDATQGEIAYARSLGKSVSLRAVTESGDQIGTTIPWPEHWPATGLLPSRAYPPLVRSVTSIGAAHEHYPRAAVPVAVDARAVLVSWHLRRIAHCLVVGQGNTAVSAAMVISAAEQGARVVIIDLKAAMVGLRDYPGVVSVATQPFEAVALIHTIFDEMRQRHLQTSEAVPAVEPLLLVVNEYALLRDSLQTLYASTKAKGAPRECPTITELASIVRLGRPGRIHCLLTAESPDFRGTGGELVDEFGIRLSLGRLSAAAALNIHGDPQAGTDAEAGIRCRGTLTTWDAPGLPIGVQAVEADQDIIRASRRSRVALYERIVVTPPAADPAQACEDFSSYQELALVKAAAHPGLDPLSPAYAPPNWLHVARGSGRECLFGAPVAGRNVSEYARGYQDALGEVAAKWAEHGPDAVRAYIRDYQPHPGEDGDVA